MGQVSRYWTLVKLGSHGRSDAVPIAPAQSFFRAQFPNLEDDLPDGKIQKHLWQSDDRPLAELCLRCFISHQIEQVCIQLETQFGSYYGFSRKDLFPLVLDDPGQTRTSSSSGYQPLGVQILQKFDPDRASLATWTVRLVRQHQELNQFLLERGLCLLSDWAILNDTSVKKLQRVLTQFHGLTDLEVQQARGLLESYHAIYRRDRILQGQKGQCPTPTGEQLQAIAHRLQQSTQQSCSPESVLIRLQLLAERLRQHRIATRGGLPPTQALDSDRATTLLENLPATPEDSSTTEQLEFLQAYRQQFLTCLETAIERGVQTRHQKLKPPKDHAFLTGLHLFYCRGASMTNIAGEMGLKAQFEVTRLLKLKDLRSDVRHWMLLELRQYVFDRARAYLDLEQLDRLDDQIEIALGEQIDALIQQDETNAKTPKSYGSGTLFAQQVCRHLDRTLNAIPPDGRTC